MQDEYREARGKLPANMLDFTPVPRRNARSDGWLPKKQRAFIEYLADTGSVTRAARLVGMSQANCYTLRRAPGAESFRRAWDAALDFGVARLKDIAFERAIEGELIPLFEKGKLFGYRRKRNDALLMFCLRHYGQDASGRRTTINYFSTKASAGAATGEGGAAAAEASTTTVRTVITGDGGGGHSAGETEAARVRALQDFAGIELDGEAKAAVEAAVAACQARRQADRIVLDEGGPAAASIEADDPEVPFLRTGGLDTMYLGEVVWPGELTEVWEPEEEPVLLLTGPENVLENGAASEQAMERGEVKQTPSRSARRRRPRS